MSTWHHFFIHFVDKVDNCWRRFFSMRIPLHLTLSIFINSFNSKKQNDSELVLSTVNVNPCTCHDSLNAFNFSSFIRIVQYRPEIFRQLKMRSFYVFLYLILLKFSFVSKSLRKFCSELDTPLGRSQSESTVHLILGIK